MANLYFRVQNDYAGIDISDADFVVLDDNEDTVDAELPEAVVKAIQTLREYADSL